MHGTAVLGILTGLFFTVMLSEDSAIVSGALLALNGVVPAWQAFLACFLGMWSSDFTIYLLVKTGGARALDSRWGRALVSREKVDKASGWFARFGGFALIFSRLVLGTRTALLVVSGLMRYPTKRFLAVTMVGALGWLLIIFTLFSMFGPPFIAVFGLRWIIALVVFVSGGGATIFMVFRKRKERPTQDAGGEPDFAPSLRLPTSPGRRNSRKLCRTGRETTSGEPFRRVRRSTSQNS